MVKWSVKVIWQKGLCVCHCAVATCSFQSICKPANNTELLTFYFCHKKCHFISVLATPRHNAAVLSVTQWTWSWVKESSVNMILSERIVSIFRRCASHRAVSHTSAAAAAAAALSTKYTQKFTTQCYTISKQLLYANIDRIHRCISIWSDMQMICVWSSWCYCHHVISCVTEIHVGLVFLVPAYPGCPEFEAVKWVSVCLLAVDNIQ